MSDPAVFRSAEAPQPLAADEIHVWFCEFPHLPPRAARTQAQAFLLQLLSAYRGRAVDAGELMIGSHGKPALPDTDFAFNLSHSGDAALVALARGLEVGVDLEARGRPRAHVQLARRYFCAHEAQQVEDAPQSVRESTFLQLWTAKEAVLKALGRGLAFGLDRLEFDMTAQPPALLHIAAEGGDAAQWRLHTVPVPAPWLAHLAWSGSARRVRCFRLMTAPSLTPRN